MATRLKPSRINVDNTPRVGDGASYQNDNDFHWSEGGGDMSYEDFEWVTLTGNSIVIEDISNNVTPTGNFTVSAGTLRPGIEYVLRVNTGNTPYTMTLGTGVTNPNGYSTELTPNKVNQFKFIATSDSQLELEGVDTSEYLTGLTILSYGTSTWNEFITAYNKNSIVYCRASSNSNPATGTQGRMAFMAYVNLSGTTPTSVEFQYYRSRSDHKSAANQLDQVFVYTLANNGTWSVTERNTATKLLAGTGLSLTYDNNGNMTMDNTGVISVNGDTGTVTVNDIKQSATAPANPTAGTAWYDTTNGALKVYSGSAWDTIATGGAISDTAYGPGWDEQTTTAPSQNAVYDKIESVEGEISTNTSAISTINGKIPSEATTSNQLADKQYVLNNINSVTAYYITKNAQGDQFATYAELAAATTFYSGGVVRVPTKNDYTIVLDDENHDDATTRYIYNNGWEYQYTINETPLTQAQLNALNSGITAAKVITYDGYATGKQNTINDLETIRNGAAAGATAIQPGDDVSDLVNDAGYITDSYHDSTKQDTLTAGENIKISSNVISANNVFIITENDVTVSTDDTPGVAPYNTSYGYTNIDINANAGIEWREGAIYTFVVDTEMVVASAYRNVRVKIGTGSYIPVMGSSSILNGSSYFAKTQTRQYQYSTKYEAGGALHYFTDSNTTYSSMSVAEGKTGTATTGRVVTASNLKQIIEYHAPMSSLSVTLTTAGWSSNTQTVTATGVTDSNIVIVSPAPTSITDYTGSKIYCSAQGTNSLTFTCDTTPSNSITVNVVILK